jgi:hypothetical protein
LLAVRVLVALAALVQVIAVVQVMAVRVFVVAVRMFVALPVLVQVMALYAVVNQTLRNQPHKSLAVLLPPQSLRIARLVPCRETPPCAG